MTVLTEHEQNQPIDAEELIRSLAEEPPVSAELRARVLTAASEATATSTRKRGWAIAAGFSALCAVCVLMVAVLSLVAPTGNHAGIADEDSSARPTGEEIINRTLEGDDVLSSGVGH